MEELALLKVEMQRVIRFLDHKAALWRLNGSRCVSLSAAVLIGLRSYAEKQARICEGMAQKFAAEWSGLFDQFGEDFPPAWPEKYRNIAPRQTQIKRRRERTKATKRMRDEGAGLGE